MSRKEAFTDKNSLFINAGLLACHGTYHSNGFRQKDLKFYIELLSNWVETSFKDHRLDVKNTQIQRILDGLVKEVLLVKETKGSNPIYKFKPMGLLEVTTRLVADESLFDLQQFFFLYHFVSLYSKKMEELLIGQKNFLPQSYQIEIKHLLSPKGLIERQKQRIKIEVEKLEVRIDQAIKMTDMAQLLLKQERSLSEIVAKLEIHYPYQLNNQKKMTELFKGLSPDVQLIEISEAPKFRAHSLWGPILAYYQAYLNILESIDITL